MEQEVISLSKSSGPSERLVKGMTQQEKEVFSRSYGRAKTILKKINEYATKELHRQSVGADSPKAFATPNWPYLQAWYAGYRHGMRVTQDLTRTNK